MENTEREKKKEAGREDRSDTEEATVIRVIVSQEALISLSRLIDRVNSGFEAGRVTRTQLLNWVVQKYAETTGEDEIQAIRNAHFDRLAYLEALIKRAKDTGKFPDELNSLLPPTCASAHIAKKGRRALTKNIINDDVIIDDKCD